jgi:peptide/nickel transport system permease protein
VLNIESDAATVAHGQSWTAERSRLGDGRRNLIAGLVILLPLCVMAAASQHLQRFPPEMADPAHILLPPGPAYWLGTDSNGMDVFSRIVWGARLDLAIAVASTIIGLSVGTSVGLVAGYWSGSNTRGTWLSEAAMRLMDVVQAFPVFVLGLALVAALGRNVLNLIYVLGVLEVPIFARLTRGAVVSVRREAYMDAARCAGNSEIGVMIRHALPNSLTPALVNASVVSGLAILLAAGLSFVGAGVPAPTPEWGYMVAVGASSLATGHWWPAFFPGMTIGLAVLGFALVGDGIRDLLDPTKL